MIRINDNFTLLPKSYLFSEVARRVARFKEENRGGEEIISLGIGDVSRPLCPAVVDAMRQAVNDESEATTFRGYGPEQGHQFLREAISRCDYRERGIDIDVDEIFVSDGAKPDTGNIGDILSADCRVAVTDPVYPVYVDTNVMAGRAGVPEDGGRWSRLRYLPCTRANGYVPALPESGVDVVYLCYPNNPTGTTLTRDELRVWVDWALRNGALILFDSAYEAFITEPDVPHSIYEIEGAARCAIEFRSFSKTAGFTGVRCGYTVVPRGLIGYDAAGNAVSLNELWRRRQCTKFNGASYVSQRGAAAVYTEAGRRQIREVIDYYMANARMMLDGLAAIGIEAVGGVNAPYVWLHVPGGLGSWQFFDRLLEDCRVVGTPGVGFGPSGEGYFRLTVFNSHSATREAISRLGRLKL